MPIFNEFIIQNNANANINEIKVYLKDLITNAEIILSTEPYNPELIYNGTSLILDTAFGSSGEYTGYIDILFSKPGELIKSCERRLIFKPLNACFITIEYYEVDPITP